MVLGPKELQRGIGGTIDEQDRVCFTAEELTLLLARTHYVYSEMSNKRARAVKKDGILIGVGYSILFAPFLISAFGSWGILATLPLALFCNYVLGETYKLVKGLLNSRKEK